MNLFSLRNFSISILFFATSFFISCDSNRTGKTGESNDVDAFRENVLAIRSSGLLKNVSEKQLDSLIRVHRQDSLNGLKNLLIATGDMLLLDLDLHGKAPHETYYRLCAEVAKKYPDLAADSVKCWYVPDEDSKKDTGWMMMRQRVGNESYQMRLYYFADWQIDDMFCKLFNTRLATEKKDTRLYLATFFCTDCIAPFDEGKIKTDIKRSGVVRLTKEQAAQLQSIEALTLDDSDEFSVFSAQEKEQALKKFEATGVITAADSGWYAQKREELRQNNIYGTEDFMAYFDTLFAQAEFDTINDYNPYYDILLRLSKASRGNFMPSGISDEGVTPAIRTVRFVLNGTVYEHDYEQRAGLLDPAILNDVNAALAEQKVNGAFYTVNTRGKVCLAVYIENANEEKAKAAGFFPEFTKGTSKEIRERFSGGGVQ
jgi:hypothetical protein